MKQHAAAVDGGWAGSVVQSLRWHEELLASMCTCNMACIAAAAACSFLQRHMPTCALFAAACACAGVTQGG
jgi:hypothetical protein